MRELKFRIWSEEDKQYRTDCKLRYLFTSPTGLPSTVYNDEGDRFDIEQYTGLKDKNGKEIYEGDIVRNTEEVAPNKSSTYKIYYDQSHAMYGMLPVDGKIGIGNFYGYTMRHQFEVIGNIHENSELLEEE